MPFTLAQKRAEQRARLPASKFCATRKVVISVYHLRRERWCSFEKQVHKHLHRVWALAVRIDRHFFFNTIYKNFNAE